MAALKASTSKISNSIEIKKTFCCANEKAVHPLLVAPVL
jgi:hypothetical protein